MSIPTVFISYSHLDEPWKDRLVKHLGIAEEQGLLQTWNDRKLLGGDEWFDEIINAIERGSIAVLLVSYNSLTSSFILNEEVPRMLAQLEVKAARFYPIVVEYCDWGAVKWLTQFNLRPPDGRPIGINKDRIRTDEQINYDLTEIAQEIRLLPPLPAGSPKPEPLTGKCPYLGLEAFTEDKEHLFFGRDDFADALFDKVKRNNFVALVGPSGSGKSSVVQAGLFPRLRRDKQAWVTSFFQPQENPFLSLAAEFINHWQPQASSSAFINQAAKLATELKDSQYLIEAVHRTVVAPDARLLLVVDQFEELFTLCSESDRRAFLDALLSVKGAAPVTVLLTLRADFMGQAQNFSPAFSQVLDDGIVSHRPLTRADLEAIITGPARYAGLEFEPGLVNLILQEVAIQPDSLPLLEYALKEMWHRRQGQRIGHALYEAVGKVEGAISRHADAVLHSLPEAEQPLALRALSQLVRVAGEEDEADTRLRLPLSELHEAERASLQTFVTARLLVTKREEGACAETIEVAHEALIRRWEKLRGALDSDREFLTWRRRLASRRKAWEQKGRDDKWLLYGGERDDAQRWLNERRAELTDAEIKFIIWDDRSEFQIERILSEIPSILLSSNDETRKSWFATLVFCREKEKALSIAHEIEGAHYRGQALSSIAEALVKTGTATEVLAIAREIEYANGRAKALISIAKALVKAGMATEALAIAREIEVANYHTKALSSIAEALAKAGMATEALDAAREIKDADVRAKTLTLIVEALAEAGMVEAREAATEALDATRESILGFDFAKALSSIAETMVKAGMATETLDAAREIKYAADRARVLHSIAKTLVEAGMATEVCESATEALAAAREIKDKDDRAGALSSIAGALAIAGMATETRIAATEALAAAREIIDKDDRVYELCSIAEALATAGMATEACEVATEALAAAREITDEDDSAYGLSSVAVTLGELGMATEALDAAREIEDADSRAETLRSIARTLVEAGMATEALDAIRKIEYAYFRTEALLIIAEALATAGMAMEALAIAREIEVVNDRAKALSSIVEALAKAGMVTEALATAREIESAGSRAKTLCSIAEALMKAGLVTEMREVAMEALDAAREIKDAYPHSRPQVLSSIAELLMRKGLATEALTVAREFEYVYSRAKALMEVADLWLEQGQVDEAWNILEEAQGDVSKVFDDTKQSDVMRHLAVILARLHSYRAAREAAEQCSSSSDRLAAYTAILREYYIERDPSLARLFAEEEEEKKED